MRARESFLFVTASLLLIYLWNDASSKIGALLETLSRFELQLPHRARRGGVHLNKLENELVREFADSFPTLTLEKAENSTVLRGVISDEEFLRALYSIYFSRFCERIIAMKFRTVRGDPKLIEFNISFTG